MNPYELKLNLPEIFQ